ncbi:MAG: serine/threonine-protein kinase [Polyangiaceae bacterium]
MSRVSWRSALRGPLSSAITSQVVSAAWCAALYSIGRTGDFAWFAPLVPAGWSAAGLLFARGAARREVTLGPTAVVGLLLVLRPLARPLSEGELPLTPLAAPHLVYGITGLVLVAVVALELARAEVRPDSTGRLAVAPLSLAALASLGLVVIQGPVRWVAPVGLLSGVAATAMATALLVRRSRPDRTSLPTPQVFPLMEGSVVGGDFEIERLLGAGGMGLVYVARQLSTSRLRALKVLHPQRAFEERSIRRFELEAIAVGKVRSAHVVDIVNAGVDPETRLRYIAMELLEGEDLRAHVDRRGPLALDEAAAVFEQLTDGLAAAHRSMLVHRDLKPENVFLDQSEGALVVKLLDFGIAKLAAEVHASMTGAIGTPFWMAPEQAELAYAAEATSDIWSLGLLVYYTLVGREYWIATTAVALISEIRNGVREPASVRARARGRELPAGFDAWFARCLSLRPSDRFLDAAAAWQALRPILGEPNPEVIAVHHRRPMGDTAEELPAEISMPSVELQLGGPPETAALPPSRRSRPRERSSGLPSAPSPMARSMAAEPTSHPPNENATIAPPSSLSADAGRRARNLSRWAPVAALTAVSVSVAALYGVRAARRPATTASASASASAPSSASSAPSVVAIEPIEARVNPRVVESWGEVRKGAFGLARAKLWKIINAGKASASESLWWAAWGPPSDATREQYKRAASDRDELTATEVAWLDAAAPYFSTPPNYAGTEKALRKLLEQGEQPEVALAVAGLRRFQLDLEGARAALDLISDPRWQGARYALRASIEADFLETKASREDWHRCLEAAPDSYDCLVQAARADGLDGACSSMGSLAERARDLDPESAEAYGYLLWARHAAHAPDGELSALAEARAARLNASDRGGQRALMFFKLDAYAGRFDSCRRVAERDLASVVANQVAPLIRVQWMLLLAEVLVEEGDRAALDKLAKDLERDDVVQTTDLNILGQTLALLGVLRRGGVTAIDSDALVDKLRVRMERLIKTDGISRPMQRYGAWLLGWAVGVHTKEQARQALAALDAAGGALPPMGTSDEVDAVVGEVLVLGGRTDSGIAYLRRAVRSCFVGDNPYYQTWASLALADVLEEKGDHAGARELYERIVERLGHATPRSTSAERARAALRRLPR